VFVQVSSLKKLYKSYLEISDNNLSYYIKLIFFFDKNQVLNYFENMIWGKKKKELLLVQKCDKDYVLNYFLF
jgi:hypothetical protein